MTTSPVFRLIALQGLVVALVGMAFLIGGSYLSAYSALLGGLVCLIANSFLAVILFATSRIQSAKRFLIKFYWAEAFKWILTIILLSGVFKFIEINALPFFIAYLMAHMVLRIPLQ